MDHGEKHWWDIFTRPGFRHCYVARWDEWSQRWLLLDWRRTRLDHLILFDFEMENVMRTVGPARGTVVEYAVEPDFAGKDRRGFLQYCSNHIAKSLGLGNRLVLTPFQLYRRLRATGGEVVYSWRDHENQVQPDTGGAPAPTDADRTG